MEFVHLFLLISISQGFLFGFAILFSPFFKSQINKYLGYAILILTLLMLNVYLDAIGVFTKYPKFMILYDIEWVFLFPVFFFRYIIKSIHHPLEKSKKLYWLFIPFGFSVVINVISNLEKVYQWFHSWEHKDVFYSWVFGFEEFGYYSFNFVIAIWSYNMLQTKQFKGHLNRRWLQRLCIWECFLVFSWILIDIIDMIFHIGYEIGISIICIEVSIFIFWLVYNGVYTLKLRDHQKNSIDEVKKNRMNTKNMKVPISIKNGDITDQKDQFSENNEYFQKLETLLKKDHIYRDPNLSQEKVAEILNISSGYLSQIVNRITKKNFTAYINSYRIEDVKEMILDSTFDNYSLLAIGLEAGFKSKTAFYTLFKKETGLTPNQFKSKHKRF